MNATHIDIETIIDYLHGELAPGDDARVMQHLSACPSCQARHDDQARLSESLRAYGRASERELPAAVVARIRGTISTARPSQAWPQRVATWFRPVIAVPLAAAFALALYFGAIQPRLFATGIVIDAAYYIDDHAALRGTIPFSQGNVVPSSLENEETGSDQRWVASSGASDIAATR